MVELGGWDSGRFCNSVWCLLRDKWGAPILLPEPEYPFGGRVVGLSSWSGCPITCNDLLVLLQFSNSAGRVYI